LEHLQAFVVLEEQKMEEKKTRKDDDWVFLMGYDNINGI